MKTSLTAILFLATILVAMPRTAKAAPPEIVTATYFGTAGNDDLQGAAVAPDGTIYVAGNTGAAMKELPGGMAPKVFGAAVKEPKCGRGFVAHLSADGKKVLAYVEFAEGVALLTSVEVNAAGVYASGYASEGLETVLGDVPGMTRKFPLVEELADYATAKAAGAEDKIGDRPGLGRYGAPFVVRFNGDLTKLEAGTYLEGWQQVWDKKRVTKQGQQMMGGYQEYFWQPTSLALLKSGDVIVSHDGGYVRRVTAKDKELAERFAFYDMCDYASRLSPDLSQRAWKQSIYTPSVDIEVAKKVKGGWPLPHYSNPRTHAMKLDAAENIYLCGWSATHTSKEPWWSPFLWKLDVKTGAPLWKAYDYDPISGGGNRMDGVVSDTAVTSIAIDPDGNVLASLLADGGNTFMERSPKGDGSPFGSSQKGKGFGVKLVHWWGQIHRFEEGTRAGLGRARVGPWGWATDLVSLPDKRVVAVGRYNWKFDFTDDAWSKETIDNPNAFLRIYSPEFDQQFSTSLPGIVPFQMIRDGKSRVILVGRAEQPGAPLKDALFPKPLGKSDGYLLMFDVRE